MIKIYLQFTYKQSLINIHYISFTQCASNTKYFFILYSGQHKLLCDQIFISTGYVYADFVVAYK